MEKNGGFITIDDLNNYKAIITEPIYGNYRDHKIVTNPSPGGGITIIQILNILEEYDLAKMGHNSPEYIYTVSMAMKSAFVDRANYVADPKFVDVNTDWLISKEHAREWKKKIDRREPIIIPRWQPKESPTTTHVSTMDSMGNAISLTHSLGSSSGVVTPGLGFFYNNCMNCFDPIPGKINSILPGKARVTGMVPTIVKKDGQILFVVGAPGGTRIITGVLQSILNVIDYKMSAIEAVSASRFDCQSDVISIQARVPLSVCEQVKAMGHNITKGFSSYGDMSLVHGILVNRETQTVQGGADPGGGGMAIYIPENSMK
jgi:gamma-glutamyltranspeptidase/glutathione hydrolase